MIVTVPQDLSPRQGLSLPRRSHAGPVSPAGSFSRVLKRTLDVVLTLATVPVSVPLMLLIALAVKLNGQGPILFRQYRVGARGRVFTIYKFRSMRCDAERLRPALQACNEADGVLFKIRNDPRITSVGRILRRFGLDELPQLYNVLRGDMSLVGPRPLPLADCTGGTGEGDARLSVLPGVTGLWQVNRRLHTTDEMIYWDLQYVSDWSLGLDIAILLKTTWVLMTGRGIS